MVLEDTESMNCFCLSMVAWCYATVKWRGSGPLLRRVLFAFEARVLRGEKQRAKQEDEVVPQQIATLLWSVASSQMLVSMEMKRAIKEVDRVAARQVQRFNGQEVSNTSWALAKAGIRGCAFLTAVASVLQQEPWRAKEMIPQNMANLLWAAVKLQRPSPADGEDGEDGEAAGLLDAAAV